MAKYIRSGETKREKGHLKERCICDGCGTEKWVAIVKDGNLRNQKCWNCEHIEHGHTSGRKQSPTYGSWWAMHQRCFYEGSINYCDYGGAGITVCKRWKESFADFLEDMSVRPKGTSIDRIDNKGSYTCGKCEECISKLLPLNVKWSTRKEQALNRGNNHHIEYRGETKT